jgi:hypothetical protein
MAYSTTTTIRETGVQDGKYIALLAKAAQVFKKGDIVVIDATDGLAYKAWAHATTAAGDIFAGVAMESKTAAAGDADTIKVNTKGVHEFDIATTSQAAGLGRPVYHEDGTSGNAQLVVIAAPATHYLRVGVIVGLVSTTKVLVKIEGLKNVSP